MKSVIRSKRSAVAGVGIAIAALAVALGLWLAIGQITSGESLRATGEAETTQSHRIVLYSTGSVAGLPEQTALEEAGIAVARTKDDFDRMVDDSTREILLTPATIADVDGEWVRSQMDRGVVLGGVNLSQGQLGALMSMTPVIHPDGTDAPLDLSGGSQFGDEPFFSLLYSVSNDDGTRMSRGGTSNQLYSLARLLQRSDNFIERAGRFTP